MTSRKTGIKKVSKKVSKTIEQHIISTDFVGVSSGMSKKIKTIDQRNSIRVALVGCVSSGKSTLLNAICVNEYEDMKRKRTTMLPSVYKTTTNMIHKNKSEKERIKQKNIELNKKFYSADKTELALTQENCELQENMIPIIENFVDLPNDVFLDIYDIPGLNDSTTRDIYFQWVKDNFHEFDIIINVVNIEGGMNTSDEKDILNLITECIHSESANNNREVLFLTAVNKCDDMDINEGIPTLVDEEDIQLFEQVINTTKNVVKEKYGNKICTYGFAPITARDTFIYRMLHHNPEVELDMTLINKFGLNELGKKKWNTKSSTEKRKFIREYFREQGDIEDTLKLTGYTNFRNKMNSYLTRPAQSLILVSRLKQDLQKEDIMNKNITKNVDEMKELINLYNNYVIKVQTIDKIYKTNNSSLVTELINSHIGRWINDISDLSNDKNESIDRLEEYKCIIHMLRNTIDSYVLKNKITLHISEGKELRWNNSLGYSDGDSIQYARRSSFTLSKLFDNLYQGYSYLQNEYYEKQIKDVKNYTNFPLNFFPIIDKLRDNACDNVEGLITDCITFIKDNSSYMRQQIDGPLSGYIPGKECIKVFCETLLTNYDYPKDKVIDYLKYYITYRYTLYNELFKDGIPLPGTNDNDNLTKHLEKAYVILLDEYLDRDSDNEFLDNLKIINKSNLFHSKDLDPTINYMKYKNDILCLPYYLCSLMEPNVDEEETEEEITEEEVNDEDEELDEDTD